MRGLGLARLTALAIGVDSSVALDWICTVLDWIGGGTADPGMPWGGGVGLDCKGRLAGCWGGFKMVLGGGLAGADLRWCWEVDWLG